VNPQETLKARTKPQPPGWWRPKRIDVRRWQAGKLNTRERPSRCWMKELLSGDMFVG
jgi:hypothetical protein